MLLQSLSILNFKNYEEAQLDFSERVNCFVGNNGEGKTNLLDAIHYLSFCKSYFNPIDSQNIRFEEPYFMVQGAFKNGKGEDSIQVSVKRKQKKQVRRNKKEYERLADHIGRYPVVMITPYDSRLIHEGSEIRRKFMDSIISQYDRAYLDHLIAYNRVLKQRNSLLKRFAETRTWDNDTIGVWDVQLVQHGHPIHEKRKEFLDYFIPAFQEAFSEISSDREVVSLEHKAHLSEHPMEDVLAMSTEKDRILQYTSAGPHKDDLVFTIAGNPLKKFGSQGQQKSFLIALKMAQFEMLKDKSETTPVLLLDDIFDKLDADRVKNLMTRVSSDRFGQIFVTDTHPNRLSDMLHDIGTDHRLFHIKEGAVEA